MITTVRCTPLRAALWRDAAGLQIAYTSAADELDKNLLLVCMRHRLRLICFLFESDEDPQKMAAGVKHTKNCSPRQCCQCLCIEPAQGKGTEAAHDRSFPPRDATQRFRWELFRVPPIAQ